MGKFVDLTDLRFGSLTVVKRVANRHRNSMWACACDCGNTTEVSSSDLTRGHTRSCGCLKVDFCKQHFTKHNAYNSPLYVVWFDMKRRCHDERDAAYKNYGQRGISVCNEWLESFACFKEWAEGSGYREDLSLERKDNSKGYCPENCKWATAKEQANNRRSNVNITYNGQTRTLKQWSEVIGLSYNTLWWRWKAGWDIPSLLLTPQRVVVNGHYAYIHPNVEVSVR